MNILIPHSWLLEHLDTKANPDQIQKYLSLCGPSVERINYVGKEAVYGIEITTNRVDCMSVRGIAREAAAILPEFGIKATLKTPPSPSLPKRGTEGALGINIVNNPHLNHRILAIKISNIKLEPSPKWLQDKLEQVGQRPLNNAVDITNYVMWELGHPVHVFDYDRLTKKTIIVREAKKGEKIISLDKQTHIMRGGEVVYDDGTGKIIDLPGIMGTANTVVTDKTKNVLLWIEVSVPQKIRFASMTHGIRTQAAILNEKGVDPELAYDAILRAVELMQQLTKGKPDSKLEDIYPQKPSLQSIKVPQELIDTYLGLQLEPQRIIRILENLGCKAKRGPLSASKGDPLRSYLVVPPTWRATDLQIPEDIVEEIARIYGYHNLPSVVMPTPIPDNPPDENFRLEHNIKQWLADWGLTEIYTYSLVKNADSALKLKNPLTDDWVYLRRSLIPSHLEVISQNKTVPEISIFEMANVYHPQKNNLPNEELHLTLTTNKSYRYLKGILDALALKLHIPKYKVTAAGKVASGKIEVGTVQKINSVFICDLLVKNLIKVSSLHPLYVPVIAHPPIIEDLTFTLPPKTHIGPVLNTIRTTSNLVEYVTLKDIYEQNYTFTIHYRDSHQSLTDKQIAPIRQQIVSLLKSSFSATLVGQI